MTRPKEQLLLELAALPVAERAEVAHFLIATLDTETDQDAASAWDEELVRRVEEIRGGTVVGKPADEVFRTLRERFS